MPNSEIVSYHATWDMAKNSGNFGVRFKVPDPDHPLQGPIPQGFLSKDFPVNSLMELQALVTLLREGKPTFFNGVSRIMTSGSVGEGET